MKGKISLVVFCLIKRLLDLFYFLLFSALYMPSAIETFGKSAVKVVTIFPDNPSAIKAGVGSEVEI